jgi:hypothetical protein
MPMNPRTLRPGSTFTPRSISGLALWLDAADTSSLYTTDAGPVTPVTAPTEISGCVGWWDASDADSITQSGGLVSQWNDKSGLNNHATASGSARPTLTAGGLNGRSVMTFDGADDSMQITGTARTNETWFVVGRANVVPGAVKTSYFLMDASSGFGLAAIPKGDGAPGSIEINLGGFVSGTTRASVSVPANTPVGPSVLSAVRSSASGGVLLQNGLSQVTCTTSNSFAIARISGPTAASVNGYIAEVVVFNTALSATDRARVEAYLAAKWGISGVHAQATATNDPVGYWRDKSGNNRHATQATGASRPLVRGVTINGRRNIDFDGTDDNLWLAPAPTGDNLTALCVYRYDTLGGVAFDVTHQGDATNASRTESTGFLNSIGLQTNAIGVIAHRLDSARAFTTDATGRSSAVGAYAVGRVAISSAAASFGTTTTGRYGGVDGASLSETTRFNGGVWSAVSLGCRRNSTPISTGSVFMDGQLCEVLLYERNLPAAERQRLERYLAAKWGITLAPQVSNADAQDWVNRVYANGGTVSSTTASAVNTFCNAIEAAGIRDRFYRLNLFCGTGLTACLVPLYRGQSLGGTQGGLTADSNIGPFVTGDYAESAGLTSDGISKHLRIGTLSSVFQGIPATGHMSVWSGPNSQSNKRAMGVFDLAVQAGQSYPMSYNLQRSAGNSDFGRPVLAPLPVSTSVMLTINRASTTSVTLYQNTTIAGSSTTESINRDIPGADITVFGASYYNWTNNSFAHGYEVPAATYSSYSCGLSLTASQLSAYYNALVAFRTAMGRT